MSEIVKKNGKSFSKIIAAIALTGLFVMNLGFSVEVSFEDGWVPNVELSATAQQVMADSGSGSGSGSCDQCVIKVNGEVKFSCKAMENENCSKTYKVPLGPEVSVECSGAKSCAIEE